MTGNDQEFITSDEVRIVYDDAGTGPVVLLIHGYSSQSKVWHFQKQFLVDAGYRVITPDLRGHGRSDCPVHGQRMSRVGLDMRELIDHLGVTGVTLVGHSFGVNVCLAMFSLFGTRDVEKFVALDQSPRITNDETWKWGVKRVVWDKVWEQVNFREIWGDRDAEPPRPAHAMVVFGNGPPSIDTFDHARVRQLLLDHFVTDWRDVLPRIGIPTWVVTGRHNPYYHAEGMEWYAKQIPSGSYTCFEQSGHSPQIYEPEAFNAGLLAFLRR